MRICFMCEDGESDLDLPMKSVHHPCAEIVTQALELLADLMEEVPEEELSLDHLDRWEDIKAEMEHLGHGVY